MSSQTSGPLARGCCARAGVLAATATPPGAAAWTAPGVVLSSYCMVLLPSRTCGRIVGDERLVAQARFCPFLSPAASGAGVIDEFRGRRLPPLRGERFFRRHQIRAVRQIQAVAVGPVLVHAAPGVGPVVVDLAAQHVLVCAELRQVIVAYGDVVDVRHFEREVVEPGLGMVEAEEHVMIDVSIAAVAAIERADQIVLFTR